MTRAILHGKPDRDKIKHGIHIDFTKDDTISTFWVNKNLANREHPFTPFQVKLLAALTTRYKQSVHRLACKAADDTREQTKLRLGGTEDQKSAMMRKAVKKALRTLACLGHIADKVPAWIKGLLVTRVDLQTEYGKGVSVRNPHPIATSFNDSAQGIEKGRAIGIVVE